MRIRGATDVLDGQKQCRWYRQAPHLIAQWCQKLLAIERRLPESSRIPCIQADLGEPTSGLEPLTPAPATSDRSCVAGDCKCRTFRGISFLRLAKCCTVLRSRWYQSGTNRGIAPSHSCSPAYAFEVRPESRRVHQHTAYPRPVLSLDTYNVGHVSTDGMGHSLH